MSKSIHPLTYLGRALSAAEEGIAVEELRGREGRAEGQAEALPAAAPLVGHPCPFGGGARRRR